eukprot:9938984-Prorocentrum_lima.AAC.1
MTSSLVGSEMCIRDRACLGEPSPELGSSTHGDESPWQAEVGVVRQGPVSYTHLTLPTICSV